MKKRSILLIGGGVSFLLLSILFGAYFAGPLLASANSSQTASAPPAGTNPYCEQYLQDLANRLHVSVSTLQADKKAAFEDELAQLVKDGKLTQSQADAIKQRVESHQACTGKAGQWDHFVVGQFLQKYRSDIANSVATGLHLTTAQLTSDLQSGKSLNDIATAQHVSSAQLHTIVTDAVKSALTKAVSAGDLTQDQANSVTQLMQNQPQFLDHILNAHFGKHKKA